MQRKNCRIVGGTVFFQVPEDFRKGGTYHLELVFYTQNGEEVHLPHCVMVAFRKAFEHLTAEQARSSLNLPALKIKTCPLFRPRGLEELAKKVARVYSKIFGGIPINVIPTMISVCT